MLLARTSLGPRGRGARLQGFGLINPFDTWWWNNRKLIVVGGGALIGAGLLAIVAKVLR